MQKPHCLNVSKLTSLRSLLLDTTFTTPTRCNFWTKAMRHGYFSGKLLQRYCESDLPAIVSDSTPQGSMRATELQHIFLKACGTTIGRYPSSLHDKPSVLLSKVRMNSAIITECRTLMHALLLFEQLTNHSTSGIRQQTGTVARVSTEPWQPALPTQRTGYRSKSSTTSLACPPTPRLSTWEVGVARTASDSHVDSQNWNSWYKTSSEIRKHWTSSLWNNM